MVRRTDDPILAALRLRGKMVSTPAALALGTLSALAYTNTRSPSRGRAHAKYKRIDLTRRITHD